MDRRTRVSRRAFIRGTGKGALVVGAASTVGLGAILTACSDSSEPSATAGSPTVPPPPTPTPVPARYDVLRSRPDLAGAPTMHVLADTGEAAPGYLFFTPSEPKPVGPALYDANGRLIWYMPVDAEIAADFKVVRYQGEDRIAWFEGTIDGLLGIGSGAYVIHDQQYQPLKRVEGGGGAPLDLHDFIVTAQDTALVMLYEPTTKDLSSMGGTPDTVVMDCVIQEIDLQNGTVLFEWRSLDHVGMEESVSFLPGEPGGTYDYFHINSIDIDTDGNYLISARNTCGLYKINSKTGEVMWRLTGAGLTTIPDPKLNLTPDSERFYYQHDLRRTPDGMLAIFDNGGAPYKHDGRAVVFQVDEAAKTAAVVQEYGTELELPIKFQGSARQQANGNMLVGWGDVGRVTEYNADGAICFDATFNGNSYRALRFDWNGTPSEPPAMAVERDGDGASVYASWNGSTEVRQWRVLAGADADTLEQVALQPWEDFETAIPVGEAQAMWAVEALDGAGASLARSLPVPLS